MSNRVALQGMISSALLQQHQQKRQTALQERHQATRTGTGTAASTSCGPAEPSASSSRSIAHSACGSSKHSGDSCRQVIGQHSSCKLTRQTRGNWKDVPDKEGEEKSEVPVEDLTESVSGFADLDKDKELPDPHQKNVEGTEEDEMTEGEKTEHQLFSEKETETCGEFGLGATEGEGEGAEEKAEEGEKSRGGNSSSSPSASSGFYGRISGGGGGGGVRPRKDRGHSRQEDLKDLEVVMERG
eukprot:Cvel_28186.t1-p1 / transcript=Cvel_28186.t1 / gene=Cvel_28186 / organism=Chromera_velia_CCMP2878 / gene_product=hypothetical protein / transcript_product=hypothetical protein / location=Cvel_scaffold3644:2079-2801(-) / protein_length=241 / sequence_SO=supercontig / SO=protein_coding / is_pseudo=false